MQSIQLIGRALLMPRAFLSYLGYFLRLYYNNRLYKLTAATMSDKGLPGHGYVRVYNTFLSKFRDKPISICEVGLLQIKFQSGDFYKDLISGNLNEVYDKVPSLDVWRRYFPRAHIVGFDIVKFNPPRDERCIIIQGDQSSRDDLRKIVEVQPEFDVIVDDALHASKHQQITLSFLFKYLKPGGLFFIEDLHWQPKKFEDKRIPKTVEFLKTLANTGKWLSPLAIPEEKRCLEEQVEKIYFFDSLMGADAIDVKRFEDAIAVIVKKRHLTEYGEKEKTQKPRV